MTLSSNIEYKTNRGREVRVSGSIPEFGNGHPSKAFPLQTIDGTHWAVGADIAVPEDGYALYSYYIFRDGYPIRAEWSSLPRTLCLSGNFKKTYRVQDCWKNLPGQQYSYAFALTESLLAHRERSAVPRGHKKGLLIEVYTPCIDSDCCLGTCGNQPIFGNWNPDKAVPMSDVSFPEWQIETDTSKIHSPLEYKLTLYDKEERCVVCWENNPNRYMVDLQSGANGTLVIGDRYVYFNLPAWKDSGVAVSVFSLCSEKNFGVGDFGDLKRMIDWIVSTRQKAVQILSVNDTIMTHTQTDSYPYSNIFIYAFHPMYIDLRQLDALKDKRLVATFNKRQKELNTLPSINYEAVNRIKRKYFHPAFRQEGGKVLASAAFYEFFEPNKEQL